VAVARGRGQEEILRRLQSLGGSDIEESRVGGRRIGKDAFINLDPGGKTFVLDRDWRLIRDACDQAFRDRIDSGVDPSWTGTTLFPETLDAVLAIEFDAAEARDFSNLG
jgi:hypothetical protein